MSSLEVDVGPPGRAEVLDRYVEFVAARCRPNTVLATVSDLRAFFAVIDKEPAAVAPADVSGLVDWEAASVGPRSMDVAHCRINLLYEGLETAEVFTREWEKHTARRFHRWADIATIVGLLDSERRHPSAQRKRFDIEAMLQRAVNEIDGP